MLYKPIRYLQTIRVLRHRSFATFFAAQMIEDASDSIYLLVLPWLVLESGGSGAAIGLTGAAAVLPFLIISPIAGVLVDRINRSFVMIGSNIIRAAALSALLLMGWSIGLETWHLATAAFVLTAADVVAFTARGAVTPVLVPREDLVAANAVGVGGWQLVNIGGKAAAGFLMFAIGSFATISVSIALYFGSILLLFTIRAAVAPPTQVMHQGLADDLPSWSEAKGKGKGITQVVRDIAEAAIFSAKHPVLRALAISGAVVNAAQFPLLGLLLAVLFNDVLEAGPRAYGGFLAASSVGVFIAMLIAPTVARRVGEGLLGAISLALWGVGLGLLAVVGGVGQVIVLGGVMGFIGGMMVPMNAFSQSEVPDEMRGRVDGNLTAVSLGLTPVAFILTGFLMDSVGPRPLYALAGAVVLLSGLALLSSRAVRQARLAAAAAMPGTP
jgi:MFS family permease